MKKFSLLFMLMSTHAFAAEVINCINPAQPSQNFEIREVRFDQYQLTVRNKNQIIHQERLERIDYQGVDVFEGKRTQINLEDPDYTSYSYVERNSNGKFVTKHLTLQCQYGRAL